VAISATLACAAILVTTIVVLVAGRHDAISRANQSSANIAEAIARDIERNLEVYDLSLQAVTEGMTDAEVVSLPAQVRRQVLFDRSATARYIRGIYAIDDKGHIAEDRSGHPPQADFSDRDYFIVHKEHRDVGLFISRPYASRLRMGAPSLALSRRISRADGSFAGIALLAINLDYFQHLINDIRLGHGGAAAIIEDNGAIVARSPRPKTGEPISIAGTQALRVMLANISGSFNVKSPLDGTDRVLTFSHVKGSNLVVAVAPAVAEMTAEWKHWSLVIGSLAILISAGFTIVVWLLVLAVRQRDAAQVQLIRIADTDALTGVANRRKLDATLDELWAGAVQQDSTVALLFVDADHFKLYNDSYGHDVGDRALQLIADCSTRHARRKDDLVARYGGEEFVVALPNATRDYAAAVAESIRREVDLRSRTSPQDNLPAVTVSIGFVVALPSRGATLFDVLRLADEALYRSKQNGRNRVTAAASDGLQAWA
jgi:diguanylate cyclase (GGDEF)-like protein